MTNREFDSLVRRHIETEDMTMREASENRIWRTMQGPLARRGRRLTARALILALLVLGLLCGAAIAAISWGSREFLTYHDEDGTAHVNEELAGYVQPVGLRFVGERTQIDIIDAVYDGSSIVLAWTMHNGGGEQVYMIARELAVDGGRLGQGTMTAVSEVFVQPGEVATSAVSAVIEGGGGADTCQVTMRYDVLRPLGEIVPIGAMDGDADAQQQEAYLARIDQLVAGGSLPLAPDGVIELGRGEDYATEKPYAQRLIDAGLMERVDEVAVSFTLTKNTQDYAATPEEGGLPEKDNGGYILRVTRADMTPGAITIRVERVFESLQALEVYSDYYGKKLGPMWIFAFVDENGSADFTHGTSGLEEDPVEQADGTWIWGYEATMTNLQYLPRQITIIPTRDDLLTGEHNIHFPQEGLTLTFE